ncbi:MAG: fibronectin type III domain-containing protein [Verrucomicrobiota bacterium]
MKIAVTSDYLGFDFGVYDSAGWVLAPGIGIVADGVARWDNTTGQFTDKDVLGNPMDYLELVSVTTPGNAPLAPVATAATSVTSSGFTANWNVASGATGYRLDVSTSSSFSSYVSGYQNVDVGNVLNRSASGLSANTAYYYRVRAYNGSGTSGNSGMISVTTAGNAPPSPVATAATSVTSSGFTANWNATSGATGYRLDVSTSSSFSSYVSGYQNLDVGNVLSRSVSGLSANTTYYYRVRAYNGNGTSGNSGTISVVASDCLVTLLSPVSGAIVSGPPTFKWVQSGGCTSMIYITSPTSSWNISPLPVFSSGTNAFTQTATEWQKAVTFLGGGTTFFWTVGSTDTASPLFYADWQAFTVSVAPVSYVVTVIAAPPIGGKVSGGGSFKPGSLKTVAAVANSGYKFVNWTEGGSIITSATKYTFTLSSARNLIANFADVQNPTLAVTSPLRNQRWSNAVFTVKGTAKDNGQLAAVWCQANGVWGQTTSANGWANWTVDVALVPGTNIVKACAQDAAWNWSTTQTVSFVYVVSDRLAVQATAPCTLSPNYNGAVLELGKNYTMTATPGNGYLFSGWVGTVLGDVVLVGNTPKLTFTMQSNLVMEANIVPNPFTPVKGTYNGLFAEIGRDQESSGSFTLTLSDNGGYSGILKRGLDTYPFTGQFDAGGAASQLVLRSRANPWNIGLVLDFAAQQLHGWVSNGVSGGWVAGLQADRAAFDARGNPATQYAGKYTMVFVSQNGAGGGPDGDCYGTTSVDAAGKITFIGSLADGTAITASGTLSKDGVWPLYVPLYSGKGSVFCWITFASDATSDLNGQLSWIKPAMPTAKYYPAGFTVEVSATGSRYAQPPSGTPILSFTGGQLILAGGDLAENLGYDLILGSNNQVTGAAGVSVTFTLSSGLLKGSVPSPAGWGSRNISFSGVVLQRNNLAVGYFLGAHQSGEALFWPAQ